ncbi:contractile injection system protein, VgrG/Pvc8 family [Enterobacter roggenkampii]|uniref:contractile injection system protein, VgrG/Pvc8 family n=1 Tax=Enterobacter roggenkampii TaxID=1812935 RepID=UPI002238C66F|nr:contractile injection system protein, VgrG/Pvc8 family [Enterobacter roggenkampii]MCW5003546.1 contractile injection system protein, VgrG/Pvc8 family [Enterobacter roggenkampii]
MSHHRPAFVLKADNQDITAAVAERLVSLVLTDYGNGTGKSDELQITLASETMALPAKGVRLTLLLGFGDHLVDKGSFTVSGVASGGPPRLIQIYATAAPMNGQRHGNNVTGRKTRAFSDVTLGDIMRTVATDNGLTAVVTPALAALRISHADQTRESDAAFITRLAGQYNAVSKVTHDRWLLLGRGDGTTADGRMPASTVIHLSEVSSWSYSDRSGGKDAKGGAKGKKTTNYWDPSEGNLKTREVACEDDDEEHPWTQPDGESAGLKASAMAAVSEQNGREMSLTVPCQVQHVALTAERRIETRGFGVKEDAAWLTESLRFSLSSAGLTAEFSLKKDIKAPGKANKKGKQGVDFGIGKPWPA